MNKQTIQKHIRRTLIIQFGISALVLLLCWLAKWFYLYTIGLVFTWVGGTILIAVIFIVSSGLFSGADDLAAYSLSGAGKMENHLKNVRQYGASRAGAAIFLVVNSIIPIIIGYLMQRFG